MLPTVESEGILIFHKYFTAVREQPAAAAGKFADFLSGDVLP